MSWVRRNLPELIVRGAGWRQHPPSFHESPTPPSVQLLDKSEPDTPGLTTATEGSSGAACPVLLETPAPPPPEPPPPRPHHALAITRPQAEGSEPSLWDTRVGGDWGVTGRCPCPQKHGAQGLRVLHSFIKPLMCWEPGPGPRVLHVRKTQSVPHLRVLTFQRGSQTIKNSEGGGWSEQAAGRGEFLVGSGPLWCLSWWVGCLCW